MLVQNFGWPDGRLGGLGPPGSTTPGCLLVIFEKNFENNMAIFLQK